MFSLPSVSPFSFWACLLPAGPFRRKIWAEKGWHLRSLFFGVGIAASGLAVNMNNIYALYLCYGVLGGIGLGVGYIAPVSTLVKWFPDRRGLARGLQ